MASSVRDALERLGWISVPAGVVHRGTPADEIDMLVERLGDIPIPRRYLAKEAPRMPIPVAEFTILRVPLTVGAWNLYARETGVALARVEEDWPIDNLPWDDAQSFCRWYGETADQRVRPPTEDEWERAARGDDIREYPWGDTFDPKRGNLAELRVGERVPVGSFPTGASPFGLLDMAGNVDEWTSTLYARYPHAPADVPVTESWALDPHITRGGSWRHYRDLARCARRHGLYPNDDGEIGAGFRLVLLDAH
jgi:formylglycine-generating enzyme required for sulfatase activity